MKPMARLFKVFNTDRTKNREVIWYTLLEIKINRYKEQIDAVVIDLNSMNIFLGYNWLVKHNLEVDYKIEIICFTRCPKSCRI